MKRWHIVDKSQLYSIEAASGQENVLSGTKVEKEYIELLKRNHEEILRPTQSVRMAGIIKIKR